MLLRLSLKTKRKQEKTKNKMLLVWFEPKTFSLGKLLLIYMNRKYIHCPMISRVKLC